MSYVQQNLISGEKLIYQTRRHWSVMFWDFVVAILVAAGGVVCFLQRDTNYLYAGILLLVFAGGIIVLAKAKRNSIEMAVTNRRVIIKTGMFGRRSLEIMLAKVESIGVDETAFGRLLGYGTIMIHGTGGTPEPFRQIAHPSEFRREVQQQIDASK